MYALRILQLIIVSVNPKINHASLRLMSIIQYGDAGLMVASRDGYPDAVRVLLEAKADPNIINKVKLHFSHCLYNNNLMYYIIEW